MLDQESILEIKKRKQQGKDETQLFNRKSRLFELPYWLELKLPWNLGDAHREKYLHEPSRHFIAN